MSGLCYAVVVGVAQAAEVAKAAGVHLPYDKALQVVHAVQLEDQQAWRVWCKSGSRPADVPARPDRHYRASGWQGWAHWLGAAPDKANNRRSPAAAPAKAAVVSGGGVSGGGGVGGGGANPVVPFEEALAFARSLKINGRKTSSERALREAWNAWNAKGKQKRPVGVPSDPDVVYSQSGWRGWEHWLGTGGAPAQQFLPFGEALAFARTLQLASIKKWRAWCKSGARPSNIPSSPATIYQHSGWQGYTHWLGMVAPEAQPAPGSVSVRKAPPRTASSAQPPAVQEAQSPALHAKKAQSPVLTIPHGHNRAGTAATLAQPLPVPSKTSARAPSAKAALAPKATAAVTLKATLKATPMQQVRRVPPTNRNEFWLVNKPKPREFMPFGEALAVARSLKFTTQSEWLAWSRGVHRQAPPR